MNVEYVVETYGYFAILVGTFLEGETVLVLGGFASHRGYLAFWGVVGCAFVGSVAGDQLWFLLGRRKGQKLLEARPHWAERVTRIHRLLDRYDAWFMLGFRFLFGLRNVTPLLFGATGISVRRFAFFNVLGAMLWSTTIAAVGWFFGETVERVLGRVRSIEIGLFVGLAGVGAIIWGVRRWRTDRRRSAPDSPMPE